MSFDDDDDRKLEEGQEPEEAPEENLEPVDEIPSCDGSRATDEERARMLQDQVLEAKIVGVFIKKGVPESAHDDVLQITRIALVRADDLPGGEGKARDQYALATAVHKAFDYLRSAGRNVPVEDGADADAIAPAQAQADLVAERDFLAKVLKATDEQLLRCYRRYKQNDETLKEIAADEQIPYRTLQKRLIQFEERLRERARKMLKYGRISGALAALLLALGISRWELQPVPAMLHDDPGAVPALEPDVSTHVAKVDPMDWAAVLRGEAFADCLRHDWKQCLNGLDAARDLDPDGDRDPAVQAARTDAITGIGAGLKPGRPWAPVGPRPYAKKASR